MKASRIAALAVTVAAVGGIAATAASAVTPPTARVAARTMDPGRFDAPRQNPYFPLRPGTVSRYRGTEDGRRFTERVVVTRRTKQIQGVATTVTLDVLRRADGSLAEKTLDWYAPDNQGNVWYFGERTATYRKDGTVDSREGSWQAGVDGAVAGTVMPADPRPTDAYRQEFYRGHAEDQAWVAQRHFSTTVPYGTVHNAVRSFEWTRLEKGVMSAKVYAPGLGIVRERDVAGGSESFVLVSVSHG